MFASEPSAQRIAVVFDAVVFSAAVFSAAVRVSAIAAPNLPARVILVRYDSTRVVSS
jgi:hypothetical protein